MQSRYNNKKFDATGLVEVLTVLAILAMTMLSVVSISVRSLRQVKKNEIEDRAVALQLRSLEYAKTPTILGLKEGNYSIIIGTQTNSNTVQLVSQPVRVNLSISNCDNQSPYFVDTGDDGDTICNQIKIKNINQNLFEIRSKIVFKSFEEFEERELLGYRLEVQ